MTLRSVLAFIVANPGCTINDIGAAHGFAFEDAKDDPEYFDWECTVSALCGWLTDATYVRYEVTSFDGWKYTATGKEWWV